VAEDESGAVDGESIDDRVVVRDGGDDRFGEGLGGGHARWQAAGFFELAEEFHGVVTLVVAVFGVGAAGDGEFGFGGEEGGYCVAEYGGDGA